MLCALSSSTMFSISCLKMAEALTNTPVQVLVLVQLLLLLMLFPFS